MRNMDEIMKMSVEELKEYSKTVPLQERLQIALNIANHLTTLVTCMFPEAAHHLVEGELLSDIKSKEVAETFIHKLLHR